MGKLTFKGDAPVKKKHKKRKAAATQEEDDAEVDGWLVVPNADLALGPIYLTLPTTSLTPPLCLALQPTTGKIYPYNLPKLDTSALIGLDAEDLEAVVEDESGGGRNGPQDVHHVWVATRIPDTNDKITLRSATGKFLAADEIGVVSADREARGMQEEWTIAQAESGSGTVFKSAYGKMLSVDVVAGGKVELRADEETEGETERWKVWMQGEYLGKAKKALVERSGVKAAASAHQGLVVVGDMGKAENEYIQKYQARGQGRLVSSVEDIKDLKRARNEGKLGEAMLERRVKLKSDRYC
ncbi:protein FRG1, partial [Phenoliferia sp. Uapishka_3]